MLHKPGLVSYMRLVVVCRQAAAQIVYISPVAVEITQLGIQNFHRHSAPSNTLRIFSSAATERL